MTKQHPQFCARCEYRRTMHGLLSGACSRFVEKGSKEARELAALANKANVSPALFLVDDDEPETVETPTLSDAELLVEWKARALVLGVLA